MSRPGRVRAYVGLGSNLGDPPMTLARAVRALAALPGMSLRGVSPLYHTRPVGLSDQPHFYNAVVALDVPAGPSPDAGALALLAALKDVERTLGRQQGPRWGPREVDLDLLVFGRSRLRLGRPALAEQRGGQERDALSGSAPGRSSSLPRRVAPRHVPPTPPRLLEVPHPAAADRLFVLAPLADLVPGLVPPGWPETVARARRRRELAEGPEAVTLVGVWDSGLGKWMAPPPPAAG